MKRVLFLVVMIGAMNAGSLVYAAQEKKSSAPAEAQVESIREIQARLDQLRAMRKRPELAAQRESIDRGIEELEGDLKAMEGQPGDWSGFMKYDPADDKKIEGPKISVPLTAADRQAPGIAPQEDDGSDVRAAFPDVQEQLLPPDQADPELQQALHNSMIEQRGAALAEQEDPDEEVKETKSKPQKSGDALAREQDIMRVLSGFKGSAGGDFPGAVAGIAGEYDSHNLWLDPNAQIKFKELADTGMARFVAINKNGRWVVTVSTDEIARVWDRENGTSFRELGEGTVKSLAIAVSGDGRWVVTGSNDGFARIWDGQSGQLIRELHHPDIGRGYLKYTFRAKVHSVAMSADGRWVVTGSNDGDAMIWNREDGRLVHTLQYIGGMVRRIAISGDGEWVVTASSNRGVRIWNGQSGKLSYELEGAAIAAISNDGKWVVTGEEEEIVRIWDRESGKLMRELDAKSRVLGVAISPDGRWVVTGSDEYLQIWDGQRGVLVHQLEQGDTNIVSVAISGDGKWIVTGSWNGSGRIWWAEPADEPSSNEKLIDIINMRIEVRNKSPEEKTDIERTLDRIKRLIGQGADPAVMVPVGDGGKQMPLWQMVQKVFGPNHDITKYFRSICKEQRDTEEKERIEEERKRVQQEEYPQKVSRGLNDARAYIEGVLSEIEILDGFSPASKRAIESYAERLENLDVSQNDSLEKIEEIKRRVQEEFEEGQQSVQA